MRAYNSFLKYVVVIIGISALGVTPSFSESTNACSAKRSMPDISNSSFVCPDFTDPSGPQSICVGDDPSAFSLTMSDNEYSVQFVYFETPQIGTDMYTYPEDNTIGGPHLPTDTPFEVSSGVDDFPAEPGTYYIYAILVEGEIDLRDCMPSQEFVFTITDKPVCPAGCNFPWDGNE